MFFGKKQNSRQGSDPSGRGGRVGPSIIGSDVVIQGNLVTGGELQVDGTIQGDVRAAAMVIGPQGAIHGEVVAEEIIVRGRVIGPIRGVRVQVFSSAHVDGDIVHDSLAVETGAFCQGNIRRSEEPLSQPGRAILPPDAQAPEHEGDAAAAAGDEEDGRRPARRPIMLRSRTAE